MIVVSDTGPLRYLVEIDQVSLLPALFGRVAIPPAVLAEVSTAKTPLVVRMWAESRPPWLEISAPAGVDATLRLDRGESEAIALALELRASLLLVDERDGNRIARSLGLATTGTLGVLELGAERGLVSLPHAIERLLRTNFRSSPKLLEDILARDNARRSQP
jgi:predicted nucleic acid-binding protein